MVTAPTQRKFALTKITAGDWLFPSNDGQTLWRVYSYREDGSAEWVNGGAPILGTFWACAKFIGPMATADRLLRSGDLLGWENWESWATTLKSRREAVNEAMRSSS